MGELIPVPPLALIAQRLPLIFPEGSAHRNYAIREMAARTIYVMFYAGAVEGTDRWIRPNQVTVMSDEQAEMLKDSDRLAWVEMSLSRKQARPAVTWYAGDTREPIRDETLRHALIPARAVVERTNIPTTSDKPRYALEAQFAALFDEGLVGASLESAISEWQTSHLSKAALSRQRLVKKGLVQAADVVSVTFPNGEVRALEAGPSSAIAKAVIEEFAPRFLRRPAVLWLSQSGSKVVKRDDDLAASLGLNIDASKALPDIILVDLGDEESGSDMLFVFTEVVATDGPIHASRKVVLTELAVDAGFELHHLAFVSAYLDRSSAVFKKNVPDLAWGSFVWFAAEPDHVVTLQDGGDVKLSWLLK
ncbi:MULTISPECIES: BsuBI/PstI family type II restriction endonuclease [Arenimonas]|uniref:BsuBI/PstI family type II restriction endonuclease n=1 Tax=Arenimonas TaxID=490567 RepID=UPI002480944D|nr:MULTISPECIES: BsuBI/PstI family type II restriction endonuclease [Arenimonas]